MKKALIGVFIVLVLVSIYFGYTIFMGEKYNYVTIDINPQIEFALNNKYEVVDVIPLNDDADMVIEGLGLKKLPIEEATRLVINEATKMGYIDELSLRNYISVTTYSRKDKINKIIEDKIINKITSVLDEKNISHSVVAVKVDDMLKEKANQKKISYGKILLVERAYSLDSSLNKEKLMKLSIKEIQEKIKEIVNTRIEEKKMTEEQYKEVIKKQKNEKIRETAEQIRIKVIEALEITDEEFLQNDHIIFPKEVMDKAKEKVKKDIHNNPRFDLNRLLR